MKAFITLKKMVFRKLLNDYHVSFKLDRYLLLLYVIKIMISPILLFFITSYLLNHRIVEHDELLMIVLVVALLSLINFSKENFLIYEMVDILPTQKLRHLNAVFIEVALLETGMKFIYIFIGLLLPCVVWVEFRYVFYSVPVFIILLGSITLSINSYYKLYKKEAHRKSGFTYLYECLSVSIMAIFICFFIKTHLNFNLSSILEYIKVNIDALFCLGVAFSLLNILYYTTRVYKKLWDKEQHETSALITPKKMNYLNKDLTLIHRALNNKLLLLKYVFILEIILITLGPAFLYYQFPNLNHKALSYIIITLIISNFSSDYLKRIISPNIDINYLPFNIVKKMNFSELLISKIPVFILMNSVVLFTVLINLIYEESNIALLVIQMLLSIVIVINNDLTSAFGAILYPKFNLESELEVGNSQKNMMLENGFLLINSVIITNCMFINQESKFIVALLIYLLVHCLYTLTVILVFRNIKYSEVLENAGQ